MTMEKIQRSWQSVNPERLGTVLRDLIDIYSPAGKEEDIQLYLENLLREAGCRPRRQEVEEDRYNLLAALTDADPALYFVGHVDTVTAWDLEDYGPHLVLRLLYLLVLQTDIPGFQNPLSTALLIPLKNLKKISRQRGSYAQPAY